ncbi:metallophosphoesterase [Acidovorax sp.]|uniref:metallophosphoesterase n=1 Tax=Acidovorax sp. TaxID=1872122 RepID=UPI00391F076E
MNIQLLSDLHLEVHPHFVAEPAPGADVLVLAGDIGSYQTGSLLQYDDFGLARFSPLPHYAGWPTPVVLVPGNHEYDAQDFDAAHARLRKTCDRLGIVWLERETIAIDGVRFIGSTLWSDFDALADHEATTDITRRLKLREKAFRAADFYLRKTGTTRQGQPFLAAAVREQALVCQTWLSHALAQPFAPGPTVVVTHFAPSLRSADPRYGLIPGTAGFCNALDAWMPHADLWLHGHLHARSDYTVRGQHGDGSAWECRVVANPLGYARKGEQESFVAQCCVTV